MDTKPQLSIDSAVVEGFREVWAAVGQSEFVRVACGKMSG